VVGATLGVVVPDPERLDGGFLFEVDLHPLEAVGKFEEVAFACLFLPVGDVGQVADNGKPVTASDDFPIIGDLPYITDGEKEAGEGYFLELANGLQWVQIDLEQEAAIQALWVWHYHSQRRAYHDVIIQISNDPAFATGVTTIFNNDFDNSASLGTGSDAPYIETQYGLLVPVAGVKGRYVRLYSQGNTSNDMNHYIEVEVFGSPAK